MVFIHPQSSLMGKHPITQGLGWAGTNALLRRGMRRPHPWPLQWDNAEGSCQAGKGTTKSPPSTQVNTDFKLCKGHLRESNLHQQYQQLAWSWLKGGGCGTFLISMVQEPYLGMCCGWTHMRNQPRGRGRDSRARPMLTPPGYNCTLMYNVPNHNSWL